jgi:uncharacterized protein with FMN-binding domain
MRRLALLLVATAAAVALIVTLRPHDKPAQRPPAAIRSTAASSPSATSASPPAPLAYRSGSATAVARTDFGDVRVRVTVADGRITHVAAVELPHGNPMDLELSKPAARTLEREVLQAQSADVDTVSGATYTSTGYLASVQAALDRLSVSTSQTPRVLVTAPSAAITTAS